ncbi:hypothetical protein EVAR_102836_1 [Eumeta japonica]|uniref:Uncharacterized protein n=1 Tax=Eumeta variegata TaxID=151549 RepID=A0A4C1UP18_EUMVA|nr:hypothetical protein EVAR_102836_1 [Eumeta japonica]
MLSTRRTSCERSDIRDDFNSKSSTNSVSTRMVTFNGDGCSMVKSLPSNQKILGMILTVCLVDCGVFDQALVSYLGKYFKVSVPDVVSGSPIHAGPA